MEGEKRGGFKNVNKKMLIGFVALGLVIVLILFLPKITSGGPIKSGAEVEDDDGGTSNERQIGGSSYVKFENEYQLHYILGKKTTERILPEVGRVIVKTTGVKENEYLTGTIVESTVVKDPVDSGYACYFEVDISNGEKYQVWLRAGVMYEVVYDASLVRRINPEDDTATLGIVVVSEDERDADRGKMVEELSGWAKSRLPGVKITMNVVESES